MHAPSGLTLYRATVGIAVVVAPIILTAMLQWQQKESEALQRLSETTATLGETVRRMERGMERRISRVESDHQAWATRFFTQDDADRERALTDERLDRLGEHIQDNSVHLRELAEQVRKVCTAIEDCPR